MDSALFVNILSAADTPRVAMLVSVVLFLRIASVQFSAVPAVVQYTEIEEYLIVPAYGMYTLLRAAVAVVALGTAPK